VPHDLVAVSLLPIISDAALPPPTPRGR